MTRTLVLRKSSLGDVVLAGAVTGGLGAVVFQTQARWHGVAVRLPGVVEVRPWHAPVTGVDQIIDLQGSPASRWMGLSSGLPVRRLARAHLARRLRPVLKTPPAAPVVQRYAAAARTTVAPHPWIPIPRVPDPEHLVLAPGAAWATKRWPESQWTLLGQRWAGPVTVLGGPGDVDLCAAIASGIGPSARALCEQGFDQTFDTLSTAATVVAGDTGLLHLAAACGVPVVGIYGPTTSVDGFWCHPGVVVELDPLPCRPCSRHGTPTCPSGDHLCMTGLPVNAVFEAIVGRSR